MEDLQAATRPHVATKPLRLVAILGSLGPATTDNDQGSYGIYVAICPVVAKRRISDAAFEPMFVKDGQLTAPSQFDHRTQISTCLCDWPADDDQIRLADRVAGMQLRMRLHAEFLRECGQPIFVTRQNAAPLTGVGLALFGVGLVLAGFCLAGRQRSSGEAA